VQTILWGQASAPVPGNTAVGKWLQNYRNRSRPIVTETHEFFCLAIG
jgi:hypothetical protein